MSNEQNEYALKVIGRVTSPFKEKFGIPRQPGLVTSSRGGIRLLEPYNNPQMVEGLDQFSYIWVSFIFHQIKNAQWKPRVRPPRLGGNETVGVFASRSPFRPNNLGLSLVSLSSIEVTEKDVIIHIQGHDLLDGTPVIDIKPYIPYVESKPDALSGFASASPEPVFEVCYSDEAEQQIRDNLELKTLITQMLSLDPRPGYKNEENSGRIYGFRLSDYDVRWQIRDNVAMVLEIVML